VGSRRGRNAALAALVGVAAAPLLGSCAIGAPPGFSEGDRWVIPLIGPLEDGLLLVPALVNDKGPYVFAIDPDAHVSIIDRQVVDEAKPRTGEGPKMLDETDTQQNRFYAEILSWQIGTLTVQGPKPAQIVNKGTFDADGRRIHGLIGRDIIADSLAFGFDRDAGVVTLSTQKGFAAPAGATLVKYSKLTNQIQNAEVVPIARRLVSAKIGNLSFPMHLDLGAHTSQLRPRSWSRAKLAATDKVLGVIDEVGTVREVRQQGIAAAVTVNSVTTNDVVFVAYNDRRWPSQDIEGTLGLGFFRPYSVTVNWDKDSFYLRPRDRTTAFAERISRWQSKTLTSCANAGCVKLSMIDPLAGKPPEQMPPKHPGLVVSIVREPSAKQLPLEVLIAVTPAAGKGALKWLVANLPAGVERAMTHVSGEYVGATLAVVDASPFPRPCPSDGSCVDLFAPPQDFPLPAAAAPAAAPPPTTPAPAVEPAPAPAPAEPAPVPAPENPPPATPPPP
jgi:hypothetical protein